MDGAVGLGHRRLAVIDPTPSGQQPMQTSDQRFTIVYSGEVYNYQELRVELQASGHTFKTRSDTEVVLNAFAAWGPAGLNRFNGMFAFAIWDRRRKQLHLCRDRYGIKPLYYAEISGTLAFGSEVKSILEHPKYRPAVDPEALVEYLTFQNLLTDRTLFEGVRLLEPGTYVVVDASESTIRAPVRYWDFSFIEPDEAFDSREAAEELDRLFSQAVQRHLISDVPVNAYLSGGMDSGSIAAAAARDIPDLRTFTIGFDLHSVTGLELNFDERNAAEMMASFLKTEHYEMVLKAGDMERAMDDLVWHLEEPRVGQSYPNFYAAKLASRFGKVVLAGVGGDEIFGGYPWRYYRAAVNDDFEDYIDKYYSFWQRLVSNRELRDLLFPVSDATKHVWTRDIFRDVFSSHSPRLTRPADYINHSLYFEAKTFLHGLLVVEDKLSMAHGLETRVPFLDNDLMDFAQRLPVSAKLGHLDDVVQLNENVPGPKTREFFAQARDGKVLLREVMSRYIPPNVTKRAKQGFSGPDASWFRGESIKYITDVLFSGDPFIYEFLDRRIVEDLVEQHLQGRQNRRLLVWSLLYLETWCRIFLHNGAVSRNRS